MRLRSIGPTVVVCLTMGSVAVARSEQTSPSGSIPAPETEDAARDAGSADTSQPGVFLTLPISSGFADATHALAESQALIRDALNSGAVRLVGRLQDADVVLTVLGRGTGATDLRPALRGLSTSIVTPSVSISGHERYIEAMLSVGPCGDAATAVGQRPPPSCYRSVFIGLGFSAYDEGRPSRKAVPKSWEACANAVARDVRAWLRENERRLRAFHRSPGAQGAPSSVVQAIAH